MGTNFYLVNHKDDMDPKTHVGKRSAAGFYCWDCGVTLCKEGLSGIHQNKEWFESCPKCGKRFNGNSLEEGGVAVELGFAKPYSEENRRGVKPVSSFTWGLWPDSITRRRKIVDEYGRIYTLKEFKENVLDNCPIELFGSIGNWFS